MASDYWTSDYRALFRTTGNPIHVWLAYRKVRGLNLPIPAWVLAYFDDCAGKLLTADGNGTQSPELIAVALGLKTRGGPGAAKRANKDLRRLTVLNYVLMGMRRRDIKGKHVPDEVIFGEVADRFQLSIPRVKNIYYEWTDTPKKVRPKAKDSHKLA